MKKAETVGEDFFDETDSIEDAIKINKRHERKEIRNALGITVGELMVASDFKLLTQQLNIIDDTCTRIGNQIRSRITNDIIRTSSLWEEIQKLRRDKTSDRKKIARLIKKALEEKGYTEDDVTAKRDLALAQTPIYQVMNVLKEETAKPLLGELLKMPLYTKFLSKVRGVGVLTASKLIYYIGDITRFSQPSELIRYCGLAVVDGKAEGLVGGQEAHYKPDLKALLLGVMGENFVQAKSQYKTANSDQSYDGRKKKMMRERPEWGVLKDKNGEIVRKKDGSPKNPNYLAHYDKDARRIMMKRFVVELWKAGWLAAGKTPPTEPYAIRILGHDAEPDIVSYG